MYAPQVLGVQPLPVAAIPNRDVHRPTLVLLVMKHAMHPLIRMHVPVVGIAVITNAMLQKCEWNGTKVHRTRQRRHPLHADTPPPQKHPVIDSTSVKRHGDKNHVCK